MMTLLSPWMNGQKNVGIYKGGCNHVLLSDSNTGVFRRGCDPGRRDRFFRLEVDPLMVIIALLMLPLMVLFEITKNYK